MAGRSSAAAASRSSDACPWPECQNAAAGQARLCVIHEALLTPQENEEVTRLLARFSDGITAAQTAWADFQSFVRLLGRRINGRRGRQQVAG